MHQPPLVTTQDCFFLIEKLGACQDSNLESPDSKSDALSIGPQAHPSLRSKINCHIMHREHLYIELVQRSYYNLVARNRGVTILRSLLLNRWPFSFVLFIYLQ